MNGAYLSLMDRIKDVGRIESIEALLDWDQEVLMPAGGVDARAQQISLLAGLAHEQLIASETLEQLEQASADEDDFAAQTNLRQIRRKIERKVKIPTSLVKEIATASTMAKNAWVKAREFNDFNTFSPHLKTLVDLKKQSARCVGYETECYDALIDEYEPGAKSAEIEKVFAELRAATVTLLEKLQGSPNQPDSSILTKHYPRDKQEKWSRKMAESLNFDFSSGRADVSVHPFCTTIGGAGDVRITTRYMEHFLPSAMFGTMHEVGHALYEQGLPQEHLFTPMGDAISLGIHESQSRMWENMVGRSRAFWTHHYNDLQNVFADSLRDVSLDKFYESINTVSPSFIRVEADELTYNLHIILRFEIERSLFRDELEVVDIPAAWNDKMKEMLGVTPPNDSEGCLQDIHWSMAGFGYFSTYALGNLYAAQFFDQAKLDIPDLFERIAADDHQPLLNWLRENIHQHGQRYFAGELVEKVTGKPLSIDPFMRYVTEKFSSVYGIEC